MSCMCGDICCPSCGPAQGNFKCPICRVWASDGCDHIDEQGELRPEFQVEFDAILKEEERMYQQYTEEALKEEELARAYWEEEEAKSKCEPTD